MRDAEPTNLNRLFQERGVAVWHANLDVGLVETNHCASVLSQDEFARAAGYGSDLLRNRFIVMRALLRTILGDRLSMPPNAVALAVTALGKPFMATRGAPAFSTASSCGQAVFAFSDCGEIGVDVEAVRDFPTLEIAKQHFTPLELDLLSSSRDRSRETFFALWTRKEACAKALGIGLLDSFACFEVGHAVGTGLPFAVSSSLAKGEDLCVMDLPEMPNLQGAFALSIQPGSS